MFVAVLKTAVIFYLCDLMCVCRDYDRLSKEDVFENNKLVCSELCLLPLPIVQI